MASGIGYDAAGEGGARELVARVPPWEAEREPQVAMGSGIGSLIKRYRTEHQVTQRELAAAAGLSVGTLRDLEQERTRFPRWRTVAELTAVLGLSPAERAELDRVRRASNDAWQASDAARQTCEGTVRGDAAAQRTGDGARQATCQEPAARRRPLARLGGVLVEILGPVAAWRDGSRVPLGSARQRAVLGMLALHAGATLHREAIIDLLWGDEPPASAVAQVQRYVSRLRRLLGNARAEPVTTVGGCCYRLNIEGGWFRLDLAAFRRMTSEAREMSSADPAAAYEKYENALGLWQGDLLADVDLVREHPAAVEVRRMHAEAVLGFAEVARMSGTRTVARTGALAGVYDRVLPPLRSLCAVEPLNEQAHASLMITLAAAGQQATALQIFAGIRHRLASELGISPGAVLAHARAQVLRGRVTEPRASGVEQQHP